MGRDFNDFAQGRSDDELRAAVERAKVWESGGGTANGAAPNGQDGHRPPPLVITDPTTLAGRPVPERRWALEGWLPIGSCTGLYGDGGVGKSLLAQQLMTSVATGRLFLGMQAARLRALGVFCEDDDAELHRRQDAICRAHGLEFADLGDMAWLSRVGDDNLLMTFASDGRGLLTPFFWQVREAALDFRARLLILDTAADLFGGNENVRSEVRQFVQSCCARLAQEIDGAVLLCAHPSRSGLATGSGDSGSTGWNAAFRSRWYFERIPASEEDPAPDPDIRRLSRKKANYAAAGAELQVRWLSGAFQVEGGSAENWLDRQARERQAEKVFMALLERTIAEGRHVSHKPRAGNFAPKAFAKRPDRQGFRRPDFEAAMERLFTSGAIQVGEHRGADRHQYEHIEPTAGGSAGGAGGAGGHA